MMHALVIGAKIFNAELAIAIAKGQNIHTHVRIQFFEFRYLLGRYRDLQAVKFLFVFVYNIMG